METNRLKQHHPKLFILTLTLKLIHLSHVHLKSLLRTAYRVNLLLIFLQHILKPHLQMSKAFFLIHIHVSSCLWSFHISYECFQTLKWISQIHLTRRKMTAIKWKSFLYPFNGENNKTSDKCSNYSVSTWCKHVTAHLTNSTLDWGPALAHIRCGWKNVSF